MNTLKESLNLGEECPETSNDEFNKEYLRQRTERLMGIFHINPRGKQCETTDDDL